MQKATHRSSILILVVLLAGTLAQPSVASRALEGPRNVIILIGDGMGFEQVKAAGVYQNGVAGSLAFEALPYTGELTTYSADYPAPDSAAAGTAMATGVKVNDGVVSMAYPGDGRELETSLEFFKARCKSTGLVTTVYATHATPATFGAHEPSRDNLSQIAQAYLNQTRPNVILAGGGNGLSPSSAAAAGYTVVTTRAQMQALDTETATMVSGQFSTGVFAYEYDYAIGQSTFFDTYPHLSEMTQTALDILDNDPDGFFLMIEGGLIDYAGHDNGLPANIYETLEFEAAFQTVADWAAARTDTLVIVTADHETGGLTVLQNNGQGNWPTVSWSTTDHTAANVPIYAWGPNAEMVGGVMDNTHVHAVSTANAGAPACVPPTCLVLQPGPTGLDAYLKQDKPVERRGSDKELKILTETGKLQRSLLRFNLSAVPPGAALERATLSVWVKDLRTSAPVAVRAHDVLETWTEAQVTWGYRDLAAKLLWSTAGGAYDPAVVATATVAQKNAWVAWDLTALASSWLAGDNLGVILEAPSSSPKSEVKFKSGDDTDALHRPKLEMCYRP
jgi:alkaline phosphatase